MLLGALLSVAILMVTMGLYLVVFLDKGFVVGDEDLAVGARILFALVAVSGFFVGRFSLMALSVIGRPLQYMQTDVPKRLHMNYALKGTLLLTVLMMSALVFLATVGGAFAGEWYAGPQGLTSFCVWFGATQGLKGLSFFIGPLELADLQRKAELRKLERVQKREKVRPIFAESKTEASTIGIVAVGLGLAAVLMPYFAAVLFVPAAFICGSIAFRQGDKKLGGIALVAAAIGMFHIVNVSNQIGEVQKDLQRSLRSLR
jgi:hypothetical protein